VRNRIKQVASSPGVQGLFASFVAFAGLLLMAQAAWSIWQTFGPSAPPADVRVVDGDTSSAAVDGASLDTLDEAIANLPDDVTVLDPDDALATPVTNSRSLEVTATSTPLATQTQTSPTSRPSPKPTAATVAPTAAAPATIIPFVADDAAPAPEFAWESDDAEANRAEVEVVDAPPAHLRAANLVRPTRLVIPSIRVDSPVVDVNLVTRVRRGRTVSTWQVARDAVGFHNSSALPGTLGNAVMSAHNNAWGRVFRNLVNVKRGDEIEVYVGDQVLHYMIEDKVLVRQARASARQRKQNAAWIGPTDDERLTLVSCWPYRRPTHRIIIVARPVL
jgi:sortase A